MENLLMIIHKHASNVNYHVLIAKTNSQLVYLVKMDIIFMNLIV